MLVIFIVWIVFIRLEQNTKLNLIKKVCANKDFCGLLTLSKDANILELNQYWTSDKTKSVFDEDLKSLIKKIPSRQILDPKTSRGRPPKTSPGRSLNILFDRPGDVLI